MQIYDKDYRGARRFLVHSFRVGAFRRPHLDQPDLPYHLHGVSSRPILITLCALFFYPYRPIQPLRIRQSDFKPITSIPQVKARPRHQSMRAIRRQSFPGVQKSAIA